MAEAAAKPESRRKEKIGNVVSTKMQKTIVVQVEMRKTHPKYKRVIKLNKKFYAHDEQNSARVGDVVRIRGEPPVEQAEALDARRSDSPFLAAASGRDRVSRSSQVQSMSGQNALYEVRLSAAEMCESYP